MSQIIIQLQGGLVYDVFIKGTGKPTTAIILDEDIDGLEKRTLTRVTNKGGRVEAFMHTTQIIPLPKDSDVDLLVKAYKEK